MLLFGILATGFISECLSPNSNNAHILVTGLTSTGGPTKGVINSASMCDDECANDMRKSTHVNSYQTFYLNQILVFIKARAPRHCPICPQLLNMINDFVLLRFRARALEDLIAI